MTLEEQFEYNCRHTKHGDVVIYPNELTRERAMLIMEKVERETMREFPDNFDPSKETCMRQFDTGATRDTDLNKLDYEGFLSPLVLECYAEYLNSHRKQADGQLRDSDNWQKGIGFSVYLKSLWRHFFDIWKLHREYGPIYDKKDNHCITKEEALCAVIFNASGYLHELLKEKSEPREPQPETIPEVELDKDIILTIRNF